jgi:N utilization substance protein A
VGACVGVRGNRIKNIVDELSGERIDIVRFSDDRQVLIPNALQPAEVEEVILCQMLGRAIVLVREDQLSLAIGKRGQNVRLASKLCGWDIEIMTRDELDEQIERAVGGFSALQGVESELAEKLVGEGFLSYDDLSIIEPDALMEMGGLSEEQAQLIVEQAEGKAEEAEKAAAEQRRQRREQDKAGASEAAKAAASSAEDKEVEDKETEDKEEVSEVADDAVTEEVLHENASYEEQLSDGPVDEATSANGEPVEEEEGGEKNGEHLGSEHAALGEASSIEQSGDGKHREHT